ncbi:head maturation protease, ClpP-related [Psychrobacillus sp.]|uniref:head maturation protease, ClpP-related n=1 Tax=Psychrobacillus sp. TaxID=1871623 RepID=UPI0028BE95B3|nr:head maturation protease, ClpP-related [Psychrobacillus sp.]
MKIDIKGPIIGDADQWIYDWFGIPAVSPGKVSSAIEQAVRNQDRELQVIINSGGGSVFAASEIYTNLKAFDGIVKNQIVGVAASAASVIAMSGIVEMSPTAQLMIHNAQNGIEGDYRDMNANSEFLQKINLSIINAYSAKTGKTVDELKNMMDATTWMTAHEAKEAGFIDTVMFENEYTAVANLERPELVNGMLPREVIDKVRQELSQDPSHTVVNSTSTLEEPISQKGGNTIMDFEKLKNEHPELFEKVKNEGYNEGAAAENLRIKNIEDLAIPGNEALVNAAKFDDKITAEALAVNIIKAEKARGTQTLANLQQDAEPLNEVVGGHAPQNKATEDEKVVNEFEKLWGGK